MREFQHFLNTTNTSVLVLGQSRPVLCALPPRQQGQILLEARYNSTSCEDTPTNLVLTLGLPVAVVLTSVFFALLVVFAYRFEIAYVRHLYRLKRTSEGAAERAGCRWGLVVYH